MTTPFFTTQTLLAAASLRKPSRNITVSTASASALIWRASTAPSKLVLLMWAFCQRKSSALTQDTPSCRCSGDACFMSPTMTNTVGRRSGGITWSRTATPRVTWM
ncbi:hypothetical protein D9M68_806930 [compost metagenome]